MSAECVMAIEANSKFHSRSLARSLSSFFYFFQFNTHFIWTSKCHFYSLTFITIFLCVCIFMVYLLLFFNLSFICIKIQNKLFKCKYCYIFPPELYVRECGLCPWNTKWESSVTKSLCVCVPAAYNGRKVGKRKWNRKEEAYHLRGYSKCLYRIPLFCLF